MSDYEYLVLPAPRDAPRIKGVKGTEARFAHAMADLLNRQGQDGWEYQRTETMTAEARRGILGRRQIETVSVLVFRRRIETGAAAGWHDLPGAEAAADPRPAGQDYGRGPRTGRLTAARGPSPEVTLRPVPGPGRG